mgnify:CR=1 FL=1
MTMSIEEFKEIYKTSTQQTDASEEQAEETIQKEIGHPNSTYMVVSKIGYLIGVPKEIFDRGQLDGEHYAKMDQNKNARIIRNAIYIERPTFEKYFCYFLQGYDIIKREI